MRKTLLFVFSVAVLLSARAFADEAQVRKLLGELTNSDAQVSMSALDGLAELGPEAAAAVPALVKTLSSANADLRWRACRTLGAIGPKASDAVPALLQGLTADSANVRAYAAFALGRIGQTTDPILDGLSDAMFDKEVLVRRAAGRALLTLNPPVDKMLPRYLKLLEEGDPTIVIPALHSLAERGKEVVPRLRAGMKNPRAAYWACLVLAEIGPDAVDAVPEIRSVLSHEDPDCRMEALLALGQIGPGASAAVPEIIKALKDDPFTQVQLAAAFALAKIDPEGTADEQALEGLLAHDDAFLRTISAWALAQMNPDDDAAVQRAVKLLVEGLKSDDDHLQSASARGLMELKASPEVVAPVLVEALNDDDPTVVGNALEALAALGPEAIPRVAGALGNKDLREFAVRILYRMGTAAEPAVPAIVAAMSPTATDEAERHFQRELRLVLAQIGTDAKAAVPALIKSLDAQDIEIQGSSAYALGKIGPAASEAVPKLRQLLEGNDELARRVSVWALLKIQPNNERLITRAVPLLTAGLQSERALARQEAAASLGEIGAPAKSAIPALKKLLNDPVPAVREAAAAALEKLDK